MKSNMALFDVVRLDHFRGFAAYWEVGADEETAINGKWRKGCLLYTSWPDWNPGLRSIRPRRQS